jgi:prophage regulatory protein
MNNDLFDSPPQPQPARANAVSAIDSAEVAGRRLDDVRLLRLPQVFQIVGLGRSMVYQLEAERRFPRRVKIGARAVGWIESEVQTWLRQKDREWAGSSAARLTPCRQV